MVAKTLARFIALLAALCIPVIAFAQAASMPNMDPLSYQDALTEIVQLLLTLKGASAFTIALVVVQVCMRALRTPLADKLGKWKLVSLLGLSTVASFVAAKIAGASWVGALASGPVMFAIQNTAHQLWAQFTEKPDTAPGAEH